MSAKGVVRSPGCKFATYAAVLLLAGVVFGGQAQAAADGALAPPHAETGLDTNGDLRYNYLQLDVRISVAQAGRFGVHVQLNDDLDLADLTSASTSAYLDLGTTSVRILLNGPDIYNGGVDGPYYAHITLKSEYGTVLSTGIHVTAAYRFTDFQAYAARFVSPSRDRGIDNDTDGLLNWLALDLTIDVQSEDDYVVLSRLVDQGYTISLVWMSVGHLPSGRSQLVQLFRGYPVRLANVDGPFLVITDLYDGRGVLVDFLFYETSAYPASTFEHPPVLLSPPHASRGVDADGNGLYNVLEVALGVSVQETATVILGAELRSGDGSILIQSFEFRPSLAVGATSVVVAFAGTSISKARLNGPYEVRVLIRDLDGRVLSQDVHVTLPYSYDQFEYIAIQLTPPHKDYGVDADGNGKYESLVLNVSASVDVPRSYRFHAVLRAGSPVITIGITDYQASLVVGHQAVYLQFDGSLINDTGIDGPYQAIINVTDDSGEEIFDTAIHRTNGYLASEFEGSKPASIVELVREEVLDTEDQPDGMSNLLSLTVRIGVRSAFRYRIEASLFAGADPIAESATTTWLPEGMSDVGLSFSGWEIRTAGRDGPYRLSLTLKDSNSARVLDEREYSTASHQAISFQQAPTAKITGRVVSSVSGLPLAGAELWAVNYSNGFARRSLADADGSFALSVFAATYRIIVDHEDAQAQGSWMTLAGDAGVDFALGRPRANLSHTDLVWQGWQELALRVRYDFLRDGPALRFRLDWRDGNRDGWVEASEGAILPDSLLAYGRQAIDSGNTSAFLVVNGGAYLASGDPTNDDGIVGGVFGDTTPSIQIGRAFTLNFSMPSLAPEVRVLFRVIGETLEWSRRHFLYPPGSHYLESSEASGPVSVYGRRIPYVVDPELDSDDLESERSIDVDIRFRRMTNFLGGRQSTYLAPTPRPPDGLVAKTIGADVVLEWTPPVFNEDGSRIVNLAGYRVYRSSFRGIGYLRIDPLLLRTNGFRDVGAAGDAYYYVVTAVNTDGRASAFSAEASTSSGSQETGSSWLDSPFANPPSGAILSWFLLSVGVVLFAGALRLLRKASWNRARTERRESPHYR